MGWRKLILGGFALGILAASHELQLSSQAIGGLVIVAVIAIGSQATVDSIIAYLAGKKSAGDDHA